MKNLDISSKRKLSLESSLLLIIFKNNNNAIFYVF